ncbi:MAG TPA: hypothetical protein VK730_14370 [Solirubrobacteraceae bacterium]|jgi:hypothetical protein|nr:hypothetical protein [Solirubrobacteraceae bacterium]
MARFANKYGLAGILLAFVLGTSLVATSSAMAVIKNGEWEVNKLILAKGSEEQYVLKSNTNFTFTGEENKTKFQVQCTGVKIQGMAKIFGGNPGTNSEQFTMTGCSITGAEKAECEVANGEVKLEKMESEIVENENVAGEGLLVFREAPAQVRLGTVGIKQVGNGNGCKVTGCPNMKGSVLASVASEKAEVEMKITFNSALIKYVKVGGAKPVGSFELGELTPAEFKGSINIELTTKAPFKIVIK